MLFSKSEALTLTPHPSPLHFEEPLRGQVGLARTGLEMRAKHRRSNEGRKTHVLYHFQAFSGCETRRNTNLVLRPRVARAVPN